MISTEEKSDSESASFYSFDTDISDVKLSEKLTKYDSFKSFESVNSETPTHFVEGLKSQKEFSKSCRASSEISKSSSYGTLIAPENSVNVVIMLSNSGTKPKTDMPKADKEPEKKKKGLRISFKRKKNIKKVIGNEGGVSGTDSDLSSSNPVTPQVTPHGTLEKNVSPPWTSLEEKNNVGKPNQVSGKTQSEKRFGPLLILMRESKKQKESPPVSLPNKSSSASGVVQLQCPEGNRKIITPEPSIANVEDFESVTDRVTVSEKVNLFQNLSKNSSVGELGMCDDNYTSTFYSSRTEKYVSINIDNEEGIDIAEGPTNFKNQVEEKIVPESDTEATNLSDLKPVVEGIIEDVFKVVDKEIADSESKDVSNEIPANDAKSIADEIIEAELNKNNFEKSYSENENEELQTNKVTIRKKISFEDKTTSENYYRPNYLSFTDPISLRSNSSNKSNYGTVNQSLTSTYPSFSSKIVIAVEPDSIDSSFKTNLGKVFKDSLTKNVDKPYIRFPKPLSFKYYAPFGKACRSKVYISKSLSPSYSNETEDGFRIPRKLPTSYSNMYISSEGDRSVEPVSNVESSGQLSDSWAVSSSEKKEHLYKILVIGELGTGKTSIIKRYVHQFFCQHYRATIGVDFALKVLNWDDNTIIRLQLWDIAGQERYGNMTRVYYKQAVGAFVVFDVSNSKTFDAVTKWKNDLDSKVTLPDGSNIPTILLANKCDQPKEGLVASPSKMDDYCREKNFAGWFETSAKEDINIDEATKFLISKILNNEEEGLMVDESFDKDKFSIDDTKEAEDKKKCMC